MIYYFIANQSYQQKKEKNIVVMWDEEMQGGKVLEGKRVGRILQITGNI